MQIHLVSHILKEDINHHPISLLPIDMKTCGNNCLHFLNFHPLFIPLQPTFHPLRWSSRLPKFCISPYLIMSSLHYISQPYGWPTISLRLFFLGSHITPHSLTECKQKTLLFTVVSTMCRLCQAQSRYSINITSQLFLISQFWYIVGAQKHWVKTLIKDPQSSMTWESQALVACELLGYLLETRLRFWLLGEEPVVSSQVQIKQQRL